MALRTMHVARSACSFLPSRIQVATAAMAGSAGDRRVSICPILLFLVVASLSGLSAVKIGSFNIQIFGKTKLSKPDVVKVLVQVIQRYDIVAIQEIRDRNTTDIVEFLKEVNKTGPHQYQMVISERLGRGISKEQYAFLYRSNSGIRLIHTYQYPDYDDAFMREPFAVHFELTGSMLSRIGLVVIHTSPEKAPKEIDALADVLQEVRQRWDQPNVILMGDFNADCSYFNKGEKERAKLRSSEYIWLVDDDVDTTVSATDCAYDRFVIDKDFERPAIVDGSVQVFNFQEEYGLTLEQAKLVSDHFPIELDIDGDYSSVTGSAVSCRLSISQLMLKIFALLIYMYISNGNK